MTVSFRPRRGTEIDWRNKNPRLGQGEMGFELGTGGQGGHGYCVVITHF